MKKLKLVITLLLVAIAYLQTNAQVTPAVTNDPTSYWQLSARGGYDFPLYNEDFEYIDYKGGVMGGLSLNKYWKHWGFQMDFDIIKNTPTSTLPNPLPYQGSGGAILIPTTTQKVDITRMFVGVGPAYKYQSQSNKWTTEASVLGGIGFINGGEILVQGSDKSVRGTASGALGTPILMTYHSGFDHEKAATLKAQIRETYWFKGGRWGVHAGAYYMNHFGVNESKVNPLLISNGFLPNNSLGNVYYYQMGSFTTTGTAGTSTAFNENQGSKIRVNDQIDDQRQKISLASAGVFAGISYRFSPSNRVKKDKIIVDKKDPCCGTCPIYGLTVTARDKYTKEVLADTDVAIKNSKGEIVKTAKTNAFGVVVFDKILQDDYTISGLLNNVALIDSSVKKAELICDKVLQKEILYGDRNFIVKGRAVVCNSATPISGINVSLENKDLAFKKSTMTDNEGNFLLHLPETGTYDLYGRKESYFSQIEKVSATDYNRDKTLFVKLEICAQEAECGKGLGLRNILFDLDKYVIKEIAKVELNRLVRFMQDNPGVKVEVGSHTDCRSSSAYNQTLSQNRANASVDYVVSQGIERSRISGKGYGESQLLNECGDGVSCSEDQHAINRRTEMKVICPPKK